MAPVSDQIKPAAVDQAARTQVRGRSWGIMTPCGASPVPSQGIAQVVHFSVTPWGTAQTRTGRFL